MRHGKPHCSSLHPTRAVGRRHRLVLDLDMYTRAHACMYICMCVRAYATKPFLAKRSRLPMKHAATYASGAKFKMGRLAEGHVPSRARVTYLSTAPSSMPWICAYAPPLRSKYPSFRIALPTSGKINANGADVESRFCLQQNRNSRVERSRLTHDRAPIRSCECSITRGFCGADWRLPNRGSPLTSPATFIHLRKGELNVEVRSRKNRQHAGPSFLERTQVPKLLSTNGCGHRARPGRDYRALADASCSA